jgi:FkbH-like protein
MFEFDRYDPRKHEEAARPLSEYQPRTDMTKMSLLFWSEHCVECAAPDCYTSCDLYESRADGRCRRFLYGAYRNPHFASARGYGTEISFKKWARLKAVGNFKLEPLSDILQKEALVSTCAPLVNVAGGMAARLSGDPRLRHTTHSLLERMIRKIEVAAVRDEQKLPDAFVLEGYNPGSDPISIQCAIHVTRHESDFPGGQVPPFLRTVTFPPGYACFEFEKDGFRHVIESKQPFDVVLTPEAEGSGRIVLLTADFVQLEKEQTVRQPDIKCVVWDLDHTVWDGILVESGEVRVRETVRKALEELDRRGILLSIASKNDREAAWEVLKREGLADYFVSPQIHWQPKSESLRRIAKHLNLGIDTFAFVDDNPFELDEVSRVHTDVECVPIERLGGLLDHPRFQGSDSVEAKNRRGYYQDAIVRDEKHTEFGDDYLAFIRSCDIELRVRPFQEEDLLRVVELVQRTNQLNFSGRKHTRDQIQELIQDPELRKYVLASSDRYGSYGTVGFVLVREANGVLDVEDFMLSCRVQGKFVERAFFARLVAESPAASAVSVNFRQTQRNTPARDALADLGFEMSGDPPRLSLPAPGLDCPWIRVVWESQ